MSVVFTLKDIRGKSNFVSGGSEDFGIGALNVVDLSFSVYLKILNHTSKIGVFFITPPI